MVIKEGDFGEGAAFFVPPSSSFAEMERIKRRAVYLGEGGRRRLGRFYTKIKSQNQGRPRNMLVSTRMGLPYTLLGFLCPLEAMFFRHTIVLRKELCCYRPLWSGGLTINYHTTCPKPHSAGYSHVGTEKQFMAWEKDKMPSTIIVN